MKMRTRALTLLSAAAVALGLAGAAPASAFTPEGLLETEQNNLQYYAASKTSPDGITCSLERPVYNVQSQRKLQNVTVHREDDAVGVSECFDLQRRPYPHATRLVLERRVKVNGVWVWTPYTRPGGEPVVADCSGSSLGATGASARECSVTHIFPVDDAQLASQDFRACLKLMQPVINSLPAICTQSLLPPTVTVVT